MMCVVKKQARFPIIDLGECSSCGGCIEVAQKVFRYNSVMGMMEVLELQVYPIDLVEEAIKNCPKDCIIWDEFI